jgi:hypothetical protein
MQTYLMVKVFFSLCMQLTVKPAALAFRAFELEKNMADFQFTEHILDFLSERTEFAQFLVMHPDMG